MTVAYATIKYTGKENSKIKLRFPSVVERVNSCREHKWRSRAESVQLGEVEETTVRR